MIHLKAPRMSQVEVDEADVQQRLGKINMDFVRKAEKRNQLSNPGMKMMMNG